jgi:hypothetical protein
MALFTFVPTFRTPTLLVASLLGILRQLRTWLPVWKLTAQGRYKRIRETIWMLVGPVCIRRCYTRLASCNKAKTIKCGGEYRDGIYRPQDELAQKFLEVTGRIPSEEQRKEG